MTLIVLNVLTQSSTTLSLKEEVKNILYARKQQKITNHSGKVVLKDELNFWKFWLSSACCHLAHCSDVVPLALDGKKTYVYI